MQDEVAFLVMGLFILIINYVHASKLVMPFNEINFLLMFYILAIFHQILALNKLFIFLQRKWCRKKLRWNLCKTPCDSWIVINVFFFNSLFLQKWWIFDKLQKFLYHVLRTWFKLYTNFKESNLRKLVKRKRNFQFVT